MKKAYIYTLSDPITNEIRYVGKTINELKIRLYGHISESKKCSTKKSNWINYLTLNRLKPVAEVLDEVDFNKWEFWEDYWIEQLKAWGFNLTNSMSGGKGVSSEFMKINNPMFNSETVEKMRKSMIGNQHAKGFKHSEETKRKVSENNARFWAGKKIPGSGDKISEAKSKPIYKLSKERCIIDEFKSVREAVKKTGTDRTGIYKCLGGKQPFSGGFAWKWKK